MSSALWDTRLTLHPTAFWIPWEAQEYWVSLTFKLFCPYCHLLSLISVCCQSQVLNLSHRELSSWPQYYSGLLPYQTLQVPALAPSLLPVAEIRHQSYVTQNSRTALFQKQCSPNTLNAQEEDHSHENLHLMHCTQYTSHKLEKKEIKRSSWETKRKKEVREKGRK